MNPEIKAKWVAALRSGKWKQGKGKLAFKRGAEYRCCLGVICEVAKQAGIIKTFRKGAAWLPDEVVKWADLSKQWGADVRIGGVDDSLDSHNDSGRTFDQIADAIEEQL